jgi:predicted nucleic acid-binding protein
LSSKDRLHEFLKNAGPTEELVRKARKSLLREMNKLMDRVSEDFQVDRGIKERASNVSRPRTTGRAKASSLSHPKFHVKRSPGALTKWSDQDKSHGMVHAPLQVYSYISSISKVYIDTDVFLNVFKKERYLLWASELVLEAVKLNCLRGITSQQTKLEMGRVITRACKYEVGPAKELCKEAFECMDSYGIRTIAFTNEILLEGQDMAMRRLLPDRGDVIHAATAKLEHVDALVTRNKQDFKGLEVFFPVRGPEKL